MQDAPEPGVWLGVMSLKVKSAVPDLSSLEASRLPSAHEFLWVAISHS